MLVHALEHVHAGKQDLSGAQKRFRYTHGCIMVPAHELERTRACFRASSAHQVREADKFSVRTPLQDEEQTMTSGELRVCRLLWIHVHIQEEQPASSAIHACKADAFED
jgi:hypothetical protein